MNEQHPACKFSPGDRVYWHNPRNAAPETPRKYLPKEPCNVVAVFRVGEQMDHDQVLTWYGFDISKEKERAMFRSCARPCKTERLVLCRAGLSRKSYIVLPSKWFWTVSKCE